MPRWQCSARELDFDFALFSSLAAGARAMPFVHVQEVQRKCGQEAAVNQFFRFGVLGVSGRDPSRALPYLVGH